MFMPSTQQEKIRNQPARSDLCGAGGEPPGEPPAPPPGILDGVPDEIRRQLPDEVVDELLAGARTRPAANAPSNCRAWARKPMLGEGWKIF